jgi:hypothetical protein
MGAWANSLAVPALDPEDILAKLFCRHAFDFFIGEVPISWGGLACNRNRMP